jgi:aryl-alcohol dehydrogenase-like predicted oxidoreductase
MRYRNLGRTGMKVSVLCLGTMTFGWSADEAAAFEIMSEALEQGVNFFDTADIYSRWAASSYAGKTEEIIGRWLAEDRGRRDRIVLATKVRGSMSDERNDQGLSRRHIVSAVEGSLRRLQTDYIDLYQSHSPDDEAAQEETLRAYDDLIRAGKVRVVGCSNFPAWLLVESLWVADRRGLARYETLQPHYNLVHREEFERELRDVCLKYGLGVIPYSPLAGGFLTGKYRRGQAAPAGSRGESSGTIKRYMERDRNYDLIEKLEELARARDATIPQLALAWLVDAAGVTAPIVGANSVEQLREALPAASITLSALERSALDELSKD